MSGLSIHSSASKKIFLALSLLLGVVAGHGPVQASITRITYSGVVTAVPQPSDPPPNPLSTTWRNYTVGQAFNIALTFANNYDTSCGSAFVDSYYMWADDAGGCVKLFSSISFTGATQSSAKPTFLPAGSSTTMLSIDSGYNNEENWAWGNPAFSGSGFGESGLVNASNETVAFTAFQITNPQTLYSFASPYLQPYVNVGSSLPTPTDFIQFYYSSSRYRDYAINAGTTGSVTFNEGSVFFSLTGMDIVTPIPSPLPVLGASTAFVYARQLRRRIHLTMH